MAAELDGIFEGDLQNKLKEAKVFVVGAGGIGCELLKNLVLTGFTDIELIDLDTIDVSNLNRQFLFHKQHVGKSKAAVAAESVLQFNPNVKIKYYHDSVIGPKFNKSFFERFNVVLNALDNLPARFHVNRMCLAAGVPLIESGTSGYTGQVELIKGGLSSCYECLTKTLPKDFPGCTIRNTPSEPIHCIVWAKHLFNQLFGEPDEDVSPDTDDPELAGHAAARVLEELASPEKKKVADRKSTREWAKENEFNPDMIFNKLFKEDITYLLSMTDLWSKSTGRKAPVPLSVDQVPDSVAGSSSSSDRNGAGLKDMTQWSIAECVAVFKDSVIALKRKLDEMGDTETENLVWDKDDKEAMDFVAACANIRAYIFHIPLKTRFEIKSMAGNIIPAIATTNAIIAGVVVLHALRVLMEKYEECASVYLRQKPGFTNTLLVSEAGLIPPNPNCIVCTKPEVVLSCNLEKMKVKELEDILKKNLNMAAPDVLLKTSHSYIISSEEGETEQNNEKTLSEMGVEDGSCLQADDYLQNYKLEMSVKQYVAEPDQPPFLINSEGADLTPKLAVPDKNGQEKKLEVEEDDDLIIMEEEPVVAVSGSAKRKLNEAEQDPVPPKKRAYDISSDDIIIL